MSTTSLYLPVYFKLIYTENGQQQTYYLEDEPVGWDKVPIILKRDVTYHGVNYQYTDGDIQLEFTPGFGGEIIKQLYDSYGPDFMITFQYGYIDNSIEIVEFEGRLNLMNNYNYNRKDSVICTIETSGFHANLNSRLDTKIDLFENKTLDFAQMPNSPAINLELHSKGIKKRFACNNGDEVSPEEQEGDLPLNFYFTFNTTENTKSEFLTLLGTINDTWSDPPYHGQNKLPVWEIKEPGEYRFNIYAKFSIGGYLLWNGCILQNGKVQDVNCYVLLRIEDSEDNLKSETELYSNHWHNGFDIYFAKIGGYEMNVSNIIVNLAKGDKVYIYGHYNFTTSGCRGDIIRKIRTTRITIDVLAITQLQSSTAQAFFVYEAIERVVNSITGKQNAIYSDYFGREDIGYGINGPGSLFTILNGFLIRKFIQNNVPLRKLTTSLKELLSSLISIFAIGLTYEYIDGNQTVRIEDKNYFFQPNEILMIEDCSEYSEETADEFVYNEIEVGYSKFPEEGEYMLDEFNTKQEYSTPIKTNKNKLSLISDLIASGYAIEFTRRLQFEDEPVDSSNYDDDNFIIAARLVGDQWKSEKNESFTVTNGTIFSPETAYNLRITPKRNLFRWAQFINGGLFWCKNTDAIKNTFYKNNGDAETLLTGETKKIKEKADIILTDFDGRNHYFKPIWIHFKCRLSPDQVRQIKEAHTGLDEAHKNGYISTKDMDGNIVSGWLYELSYSPASEAATFKLLKADIVSSGVPMSCSDFADYTFWDFENKPIPDSIEDCIFANFD